MTLSIIDVMQTLAERLKLLGDPTRLKIVQFLEAPLQSCCSREDGVCGCDLEAFLELTQPTVSYHMKLLTEAGLVQAERRGTWVYYELVPTAFREIAAAMERFARAGEQALEQRVREGNAQREIRAPDDALAGAAGG